MYQLRVLLLREKTLVRMPEKLEGVQQISPAGIIIQHFLAQLKVHRGTERSTTHKNRSEIPLNSRPKSALSLRIRTVFHTRNHGLACALLC